MRCANEMIAGGTTFKMDSVNRNITYDTPVRWTIHLKKTEKKISIKRSKKPAEMMTI